MPSRWRRSMRFNPNALILTSAWDLPSSGLGTSVMWSASTGPLPFLISLRCESESNNGVIYKMMY
jgi:hypothetical protein